VFRKVVSAEVAQKMASLHQRAPSNCCNVGQELEGKINMEPM